MTRGLGWLLAGLVLLAPAGCAAQETAAERTAGYLDWDGLAEVRLLPRGRSRGWLIGGLSGLAWDKRNDRLIAVGDRGHAFVLPTTPDARPEHIARLKGPGGLRDVEAIRYAPQHGWYVLFEDDNVLAFYAGDADAMEGRPTWARRLGRGDDQESNKGVESLAVLDFGRLLAIAEGGAGDQRSAWLIDGDRTQRHAYLATDGFGPVDAVAAPNGDVLVLERRFNGLLPPFFSNRIARIPADALDGPATLAVAARYDLASAVPSENWEGMEIVVGPDGAELWLVSDDNLQWPQNTLLARMPLDRVLGALSVGH